MKLDFYTYAWLREDRTPYYIGKGSGGRAFRRGSPPKHRVLFLKTNLSEADAFRHEKYMIFIFGRKTKSEGILINLTDGGEGTSGRTWSEEEKKKHLSHLLNMSHHTRRLIGEASRRRLLGSKLPESTRLKMKGPREASKSVYVLSSPFGEDYAFVGRDRLANFLQIDPGTVSHVLKNGGWRDTNRGKSKWKGWGLSKPSSYKRS